MAELCPEANRVINTDSAMRESTKKENRKMKQVNLTMLLLAVALCASVQLEAQTQVRRYVMNGKMPKSNADRTTTWADAG